MDYATYKKIRAYCWEDLSPYIDTKFNNDTRELQRMIVGTIADINHEYSAAMGLFQAEDLTPREQSAAQLLAAISNHRRYTWWREPVTPDGTPPAEPLEPWQDAEVWTQTRAAVAEYAFFISEREAVGLLALVSEERHTPAPAPVEETTKERRARLLEWYGDGEHGAVQKVFEREKRTNPKADRSYIGKQITKAKEEKAGPEQSNGIYRQLVKNGKRIN